MLIDPSGFAAMPLADIFFSFKQSNVPGKVIVLLLFVGSIYAWSIMVTKYMDLRRARDLSYRFLQAFRKEVNPVTLYLRRQKYAGSPLYSVYEQGCLALGTELENIGTNTDELFVGDIDRLSHTLRAQQIETVRNLVDRTVADQLLLLERQMGVLATAVSASPFLGLLGTVWGVMEAFTGMAIAGTATLSAVAPGIAAALLTTVVGLLVALPSAIGYNMLNGRIRELHVQMDNFAQEFMAQLQNTFIQNP